MTKNFMWKMRRKPRMTLGAQIQYNEGLEKN